MAYAVYPCHLIQYTYFAKPGQAIPISKEFIVPSVTFNTSPTRVGFHDKLHLYLLDSKLYPKGDFSSV